MLKVFQDHMRKAGDVCFAEVSTDREGIFLIIITEWICLYANMYAIFVVLLACFSASMFSALSAL